MFKILGTDDAVHTCDCCGKSNLKSTVVVEVNGEILNYGSVCATRHTGLTSREITSAIRTRQDGQKAAARKEYELHPAILALTVKQAQARRDGIAVGKAFAEYCATERAAAHTAHAVIRAKFNGIDF